MLPHGWLFPGRGCTDPISTRQINRAIHEAAEAAGIRKRVSPHTLLADSDEASHRFRRKPATCSDRSQPGIPTEASRGGGVV